MGVKLQKLMLACILIIFVKKAKQKMVMDPFSLWFPREIRYPLLHKDLQLTGDLPHCSAVQTRYQHLLPRRLRGDRVCILQCATRCDLPASGNGYSCICIKNTVCQYFSLQSYKAHRSCAISTKHLLRAVKVLK